MPKVDNYTERIYILQSYLTTDVPSPQGFIKQHSLRRQRTLLKNEHKLS